VVRDRREWGSDDGKEGNTAVPNLNPDGPPIEVHVGDVGRLISYLWKNDGGETVRNLNGYAARIFFCIADQTPHVIRDAAVDTVNGKTKYRLRGDEFPTAEKLVLVRFQLMPPDYYLVTAAGRSFVRTSSRIFKFRVKAVPA